MLYLTAAWGGNSSAGFVFSRTPPATPGDPWTQTVLYSFGDLPDGQSPAGPLVMGGHGILYGTTSSGGVTSNSTVFSLAPPAEPGAYRTEKGLHSFGGSTGGPPVSGVVIGGGGVLYGSTVRSQLGYGARCRVFIHAAHGVR